MRISEETNFRKLFLKNFRTVMTLVALPLMVMMILLTLTLVSQRFREDQRRHEMAFAQAVEELSTQVSQEMRIAVNVGNESAVKSLFWMDMNKNTSSKFTTLGKISSYIQAILNNNPMISDVFLSIRDEESDIPFFIRNNSAYHHSVNADKINDINFTAISYALTNTIYESLLAMPESSGFVVVEEYLYYGRPIGAGDQSFVAVSLSNAQLRTVIKNITGSARMVAAIDGTVVFDTQPRTFGGKLSDIRDKSRTYSLCAETDQGWECVYYYDMNESLAFGSRVCLICMGIMLVVLVLSIFLCRRISARLIRPYQTILELLANPDQSVMEQYDEKYAADDELGLIYGLIHETQYEKLVLRSDLIQREEALTEAQNIALQSQITPHFLFNTLETINWRLFEKLPEENEIPRMIQKLSLLFRMSLDSKEKLVPLEREMIYAKAYLDLQDIRFEGRYQVTWEVEERTRMCMVPCMCLQPLLENAISYGVTKVDDGRLAIRARIEGDVFILEVEDNGPGTSPEKLVKIQESLRDSRFTYSDHIGLINVNARAQLLFGLDYGLSVESIPYEMTRMRLRIPSSFAGENRTII